MAPSKVLTVAHKALSLLCPLPLSPSLLGDSHSSLLSLWGNGNLLQGLCTGGISAWDVLPALPVSLINSSSPKVTHLPEN